MKLDPDEKPLAPSKAWLATMLGLGTALRLACADGVHWADSFDYATVALSSEPIARYATRYGVVWPVMLLQRLFGQNEVVMAAYPLFCSVATLVTTYALGRRLHGEASARWAVLLLAMTPVELVFSTHLLPDVCAAFWVSLALLLLLRGTDGPARWPLLLSAASWYIGVQNKEVACVLGPVFLWLAWRAGRWRGLYWFGIGLFASIACDAALCALLWGDPIWKVRALSRVLSANLGESSSKLMPNSIVEILFYRPATHSTTLSLALASLVLPAMRGPQRRLLVAWLALVGGFLFFCDLAFPRLGASPRYLPWLSVPLALLSGPLVATLRRECGLWPAWCGATVCLGGILAARFGPGELRTTLWSPLAAGLASGLTILVALALVHGARRIHAPRVLPIALIVVLALDAGLWAGAWIRRRQALQGGAETSLAFLRTVPLGTVEVADRTLFNPARYRSGYREELDFVLRCPPDPKRDRALGTRDLTGLPHFDSSAGMETEGGAPRYCVANAALGQLADQRWTLLFRRGPGVYLWAPGAGEWDRFLQQTAREERTLPLVEARARVLVASGRPRRAVLELDTVAWWDEPSGQLGLLYDEAASLARDESAVARASAWINAREVLESPRFVEPAATPHWRICMRPGEPIHPDVAPGLWQGDARTLSFTPGPASEARIALEQTVSLHGCPPLVIGSVTRVEGFERGGIEQTLSLQFLDEQGVVLQDWRWRAPAAAHEWMGDAIALPRPPRRTGRLRVCIVYSGRVESPGVVHLDRLHVLRSAADP